MRYISLVILAVAWIGVMLSPAFISQTHEPEQGEKKEPEKKEQAEVQEVLPELLPPAQLMVALPVPSKPEKDNKPASDTEKAASAMDIVISTDAKQRESLADGEQGAINVPSVDGSAGSEPGSWIEVSYKDPVKVLKWLLYQGGNICLIGSEKNSNDAEMRQYRTLATVSRDLTLQPKACPTAGHIRSAPSDVRRLLGSSYPRQAVDAWVVYPEVLWAKIIAPFKEGSYRRLRLTYRIEGGVLVVSPEEVIDHSGMHIDGWNDYYI